jgi:hypothetical protein
MLAKFDQHGIITNSEDLTVNELAMSKVWCPACHEKVFQKWSGGWDGHAGWKCSGLSGFESAEPEVRKREFKRRFLHLFR